MVASLEKYEIVCGDYIKLWFLSQNNSSIPYLLAPLRSFTLEIVGDKKDSKTLKLLPRSPTAISADIKNTATSSAIFQGLTGALREMSTKDTKITDRNGNTLAKIGDEEQKRENIRDQTGARITATMNEYGNIANTINYDILRKNTIWPNQNVSGSVYFLVNVRSTSIDVDLEKCLIRLYIRGQSGTSTIYFTPKDGE
jgi:hypothetical protein